VCVFLVLNFQCIMVFVFFVINELVFLGGSILLINIKTL